MNPSKLTPVSTYGPSREIIPELNHSVLSSETDWEPPAAYPGAMGTLPVFDQQAQYAPKPQGLNNFVDLQTGTACINGYLFKLKPAEIKRIKKALTEGAIADLKKANGHGAKA